MTAVNYSTVRENLKRYCDMAVENYEPVVVTRKLGQNVVIMSVEQYSNMIENMYIRSSEANYRRLLESIADAEAGKVTEHELIEVEDDA